MNPYSLQYKVHGEGELLTQRQNQMSVSLRQGTWHVRTLILPLPPNSDMPLNQATVLILYLEEKDVEDHVSEGFFDAMEVQACKPPTDQSIDKDCMTIPSLRVWHSRVAQVCTKPGEQCWIDLRAYLLTCSWMLRTETTRFKGDIKVQIAPRPRKCF